METIEMVKCFLAKTDDEQGGTRYVPFEIYELWRFLMERVHYLIVKSPTVAIWMPVQAFETLSDDEKPDIIETVIEIKFKYHQSQNTSKPVVRYFPEENFDTIFGYLRAHFPDDKKMEGIQKRLGYFFASESVPYIIPGQ